LQRALRSTSGSRFDYFEAEAKMSLAQAEKILAEAEKEREALRIERIYLAMRIIEKYKPDINDTERIDLVIKLLPEIDRLLASNVEIVSP
jgi:hypothetical protein